MAFHSVTLHGGHEEENMFAGAPSSLSTPLEIKKSFSQRIRSIDWLDWLSAIAALLLMYAVFGSYFYALLYAAEAIRGEDFRVLPQKFYGPFVYGTYPPIPAGSSVYPAGFNVPWNSTLF